jgi:hypothetical protein
LLFYSCPRSFPNKHVGVFLVLVILLNITTTLLWFSSLFVRCWRLLLFYMD